MCTPVIVNKETNDVVYEGIDYVDCFTQLRNHFMLNMKTPGKYEVRDFDTNEKINYADVMQVHNAARESLSFGG